MRTFYTQHYSSHNPLMVFWFMIWYRVPDKSKRLFVLASLYARLLRVQPNDKDKIEELNQLLKLSRDTNALLFPVAISQWVWHTLLPIEKIDLTNKDHYVSRLARRTPCWLWYADTETRHQDIQRVIDVCTGKTDITLV